MGLDKLAEQTRIIREVKDRLKATLKDEELPRKQGSGAAVIITDADQIK